MDAEPDPDIIAKRVYTSGCGRGVMYGSLSEAAARLPLTTELVIGRSQVVAAAQWLQHSSTLYKSAGGIHTAALSPSGELPDEPVDDIGRHNAVDKVIGMGLIRETDFSNAVLLGSGRISSEILHKARRCGIPIIVARGTPTHQTVLRARDMGVTIVGRARGAGFTVYSHGERIDLSR
jgi:FdhD protein